MNKGIVFHYLSKALLLSSALFLVPALVSLYYREYFFMLIFLGVGGRHGSGIAAGGVLPSQAQVHVCTWEGMVLRPDVDHFSAVGALPLLLQRQPPHYIDALF